MGTYSSNTTIKVVGGGAVDRITSGTVFTTAANQYAILELLSHTHQDVFSSSSSALSVGGITVSTAYANASTTTIGNITAATTANYNKSQLYIPPSTTVSFSTSGGSAVAKMVYTIFQNTP